MTIDNLISWLQEAEDNNTWLVSTQSVKRHLEKIKETDQLTIPVVVQQSEQYCECEKPTLGKSISRCGTCDEWFKPLK